MSSGRIMNLLVTIPAESRRMNVGKDVIRVLGSPTYICVLQRKDRKSIAITPCTAEHPMSFKVPDRLLTDGQCRMMINGIQFIQVLLEANGLAAGKDHQFKGRYDAEKNAVIISLEKDEQSALSWAMGLFSWSIKTALIRVEPSSIPRMALPAPSTASRPGSPTRSSTWRCACF